MDLEKALEQFDAVEANIRRLQKVWAEMRQLISKGLAFVDGSPEEERYRELAQAYQAIISGLPAVGDFTIETVPWDLNVAIGYARLEPKSWFQEEFYVPDREIEEYRVKVAQARRELVRDRLIRVMATIDPLLKNLLPRVPSGRQPIKDEDWDKLVDALRQVERLTGGMVPRRARWRDMHRHMNIGQGVDLHDIARVDWPSVRFEIDANLYSELEPLPVEVNDLATLVGAKPSGPVTTRLRWEAINSEEFERLLFNIVADADDYANPQWLMHTNAPDRGRDVSVERVSTDSLSGTRNQRVIIQAKHWLSKSIRPIDVSEALTQIEFWGPPRVNVLVLATTGRFTADAVTLIEKHNQAGKQPVIDMWPESHLELLLAQRPHLVVEFRLR